MIQQEKYDNVHKACLAKKKAIEKYGRAKRMMMTRRGRTHYDSYVKDHFDNDVIDLDAIKDIHTTYRSRVKQFEKANGLYEAREKILTEATASLDNITPQIMCKQDISFRYPVKIQRLLKDADCRSIGGYHNWILNNIFIWSLQHCVGSFQIASTRGSIYNQDMSLVFEYKDDRTLFQLSF